MKKPFPWPGVLKLLIAIFFAFALVLPILKMFMFLTWQQALAIFTSQSFLRACANSFKVASVASLLAVLFASMLAFCTQRGQIKGKKVFAAIFCLPMLIPSISQGMGLVILLGANGILTRFFHLKNSIYGFWGIVLGSVLYCFPLAFLMVASILKYQDAGVYHAADILGIPRYRQFFAISLPYLKKPMLAVGFAVFAATVTDYGVPLMLGGQIITLPVLMYQEVIGLLNFGKGSAIGMVLLVPAVLAFILDVNTKQAASQNQDIQPFAGTKNRAALALCYALCGFGCIFATLPIAAFLLLTLVKKYPIDMSLTLNNIAKTFNLGAGKYLANSLAISVLVVLFGVLISYTAAYFTARMPGKSSHFLHLIALSSLAVPGIVLGLSYVLFFKASPIYGGLIILVMVNTAHFFASPYLMAHSALGKISPNLEDVGASLGIKRVQVILRVLVPQTKPVILEMAVYFFVNSMMTISAIAFLSSVKIKPISMMIVTFEGHMQLEAAAFVSLLILFCNVVFRWAAKMLAKVLDKK